MKGGVCSEDGACGGLVVICGIASCVAITEVVFGVFFEPCGFFEGCPEGRFA